MNSGNVEARLTAIEEQMQEIRAILRETAELARENHLLIQAGAQETAALREAITRTEQIANSNARAITRTEQIANSNAKAIEANSNGIAELRVLLGETRQIADSNARAIESNSSALAETRETLREGFQATQRDIQSLGQFMERFFSAQAQTNQVMQEGLEEHQQRLERIDPPSES
ncbi:hypothetical protein IFO70_33530 [Phormidium tenue FACHB-886]|nr:hypothetical protein [Phormidium tenue FACHB-886]